VTPRLGGYTSESVSKQEKEWAKAGMTAPEIDWWPFVGLYDSFGECRFSLLEVSLGYNVLPALEIIASRLFSAIPLPFSGHAD
jgi:hypothetical protein